MYLEVHEPVVFIFLDETWIHQSGSQIRICIHKSDMKANPKKRKNEGKRFTILQAGCAAGFLCGCSMLLDRQIEHRNYHKTMNGAVSKNRLKDNSSPLWKKLTGSV
jgi:hypothetical protein